MNQDYVHVKLSFPRKNKRRSSIVEVSSWVSERVRNSSPGLAITISKIEYLLLLSRDMAEVNPQNSETHGKLTCAKKYSGCIYNKRTNISPAKQKEHANKAPIHAVAVTPFWYFSRKAMWRTPLAESRLEPRNIVITAEASTTACGYAPMVVLFHTVTSKLK